MSLKRIGQLLILLGFFCLAPACTSAENGKVDANAAPPITPPAVERESSGALDFANGLYARKMYGPAISEYAKFLSSPAAGQAPVEAASARFRLADSYYFSGDYPGAVTHFEQFIQDFASDKRIPVARFRVATAKFYQKDLKRSSELFFDIARDVDDPAIRSGALFYLAKTYEALGNQSRAVTVMQRLMTSHPQTDYAAYSALRLGDIYASQNDPKNAEQSYRFAAEREEPAAVAEEASLKLAALLVSNGDAPAARPFFQKVYDRRRAAADEMPRPNTFDRALTGLFYCDHAAKDLDGALKRLSDHAAVLAKSPLAAEIRILTAGMAADAKQYPKALELLDLVLNDSSVDAELRSKALFRKSSVLGLTGKSREAAELLRPAAERNDENSPRAYFEQAEIFRGSKSYDEAFTAYQAVLAQRDNPYSKPAFYYSAVTRLLAGKLDEARKYFRQYAERFPGDEDAEKALIQAIQADLDLADYTGALQHAKAFIKAHPQSAFLDLCLYKNGMALIGLKKFKEASGFFRRLVNEFPASDLMPESLYGAGISLEGAEEPKEAIEFFTTLYTKYPEHDLAKDAALRIGYLEVRLQRFDQAADHYAALVVTRPDIEVQPGTAFWAVRHFLDRSEYDKMRVVLEALTKRYPNEDFRHEICFFAAESFMGQKNYPKAIEGYLQSIQAGPAGQYVPHANLGLGLAYAVTGDLTSAEKYFNEASKYDDEVDVTVRARFEIANLKLKQDNPLDAANAFMLVAVLYDDPKYCPLALFMANECFTRLGRGDDAGKAAQELRTRYPESEWAKKLTV